MFRLIIIFLSIISLNGLEINTNLEKNLSKYNIKDRIILVKYYLDKNLTKANKINDTILKISPNNKIALKNKKLINLKKEFLKEFKNIDINEYYQRLYSKHQYKKIKKMAIYLDFIKNDYPKLLTANVYFYENNYKKTEKILNKIENKNSLDYTKIKAYLCYYQTNYRCAKKYFSLLYSITNNIDYAYKLIDSYLFLNNYQKALNLINRILKENKHNKKLLQYKKIIEKKELIRLNKAIKEYKNQESFENLQRVINLLFVLGKKEEAFNYIENYITKYPLNNKAKYLYAKYLLWNGDSKKALNILKNIVTEDDYKTKLLIAKIYAWNGEYKKSINYLNDILLNSNDKNLIIDAKETIGLIYYWKHNYKKAKPILNEIVKQKNSIEAKEALMVINKNIKPLIRKYKLLLKKNPNNLKYLIKLAQYNEILQNINSAIKYYEKYFNITKKLEVAHKLGELYLIKKNFYKAFSYYEYWAYQKNEPNSLYEVAKNYYYEGFSKSALKIIKDILDINKNNKKALKLKAKILKYSPTFIQENSKKTLSLIFKEKNSKLLEIANTLYFNGFYNSANNYYKEYLLNNPTDTEIRERYAYSLKFSGNYKNASGEFFILTLHKRNCDILYHYAISLKNSNKIKLYKENIEKAFQIAKKPAPKFIINFISSWKKEWENRNINRYKKYYTKKYTNNKYWLLKKESIFKKASFIKITLKDFILLKNYKKDIYNYYVVNFYQQYSTNKKSDKGYKTLTLKCKNKKCLISNEKWKKAKFKKVDFRCYHLVKKELEFIKLKELLNLQQNKIINNSKKDKKKSPSHHKDIILAPSLKKELVSEKKEFARFNVQKTEKWNLKEHKKVIEKNFETDNNSKYNYNKIGFKFYYFQDKPQIHELDYGVYSKNKNLEISISKWKLWQFSKKRDGKYLTFLYKFNRWNVGLEIGNYHSLNYLYPYLEYDNYFTYLYKRTITGKEKQSFCGIDKHLYTDHFILSKWSGFSNGYRYFDKLYYSLDLGKTNSNISFTPQFNYNFYNIQNKNSNIYLYLTGWYQFNSSPTKCYYSPNFYDSTFIELHPNYKNTEAILKSGYSFKEQTFLYSYGLNYINNNVKIGCMKNYSIKNGINGYWYLECYANVGVSW